MLGIVEHVTALFPIYGLLVFLCIYHIRARILSDPMYFSDTLPICASHMFVFGTCCLVLSVHMEIVQINESSQKEQILVLKANSCWMSS